MQNLDWWQEKGGLQEEEKFGVEVREAAFVLGIRARFAAQIYPEKQRGSASLKVSVQPSLHPVFVTLKTCLLPLRCDRSPWQSPIQSPDVGHSRSRLVGQVDQDTVGQAEVQDGAHAPDFIREGLGQEALQFTDSLLYIQRRCGYFDDLAETLQPWPTKA